MRLKENVKTFLRNELIKFDFVEWDRFTSDLDKAGYGQLRFYGWIDRSDDYKDFVVISYYVGDEIEASFITSSKDYSEKIGEMLGFDKEEDKCKRVEDYFELENAIKK